MIDKRLRELRQKTGKTPRQVATEIGVSESTYREWEIGRKIRGEPYAALARALNSSVSFIITGESPPIFDELLQIEEAIKNIRLRL